MNDLTHLRDQDMEKRVFDILKTPGITGPIYALHYLTTHPSQRQYQQHFVGPFEWRCLHANRRARRIDQRPYQDMYEEHDRLTELIQWCPYYEGR